MNEDERSSDEPRAPEDDLQGLDPRGLIEEVLKTRTPSDNWEPPSPEHIGSLLKDYNVEHLIGRGGMGAVYKGVQIKLKRSVAIKLLPAELADAEGENFAARFEKEAQVLASLNHPGIVTIYDFGRMDGGNLFIVMEYVDGTDLHHLIKSGQLAPAQALKLVMEICEALQYAHGNDVVHRDIKPGNVLVTRNGRAKLADFGLAMRHNEEQAPAIPLPHGVDFHTKLQELAASRFTRTGFVMGTPPYAAPEVYAGQADARSDIFALGIMFYEMLTGHPPEDGYTLPSQKVGVDPRVDAVVLKALEGDPAVRFQSANDVKEAVEQASKPLPQQAPQPPELTQKSQPPPQSQASIRPTGRAPQRPTLTPKRSTWFGKLVLALVITAGAYSAYDATHQWKVTERLLRSLTLISKSSPTPAQVDAKQKGIAEREFTNSLGMKFIALPGTKVMMCIHETRRRDYAGYAATVPGVDQSWKDKGAGGKPFGNGDEYPVGMMSWSDAKAFCEWLGKKEGRTYRLPTDHEWSVAAGLGEKESPNQLPEALWRKVPGVYPWGTAWPPPPMSGNFADLTAKEVMPDLPIVPGYRDGYAQAAPVMTFHANSLGLYDLAGNVWEWCEDWINASQKERTLRGGSCMSWGNEGNMLASDRFSHQPSDRVFDVGFRCVVEMPVVNQPAATSSLTKPSSAPVAQPTPSATPSPIDDPAFEKELRAYSWRIPSRNWIIEFRDKHEAKVDEGDGNRTWHWWIVGPRTVHVQFSVQPAKFDPNIGGTYIFDSAMMAFEGANGNSLGVRHKSLSASPSTATTQAPSPNLPAELFIGELKPTSVKVNWYESIRVNRYDDSDTREGRLPMIRGKVCSQYILAHAPSRVEYAIPSGYAHFKAIGFGPTGTKGNPALHYSSLKSWKYLIEIDGKRVFESKELSTYPNGEVPIDIALPEGSKSIALITDPCGSSNSDHSMWGYPVFVRQGAAVGSNGNQTLASAKSPTLSSTPVITLFAYDLNALVNACFAATDDRSQDTKRTLLTGYSDGLVKEGRDAPAANLDAYRAAYLLCNALISIAEERKNAKDSKFWSARTGALRPHIEDLLTQFKAAQNKASTK